MRLVGFIGVNVEFEKVAENVYHITAIGCNAKHEYNLHVNQFDKCRYDLFVGVNADDLPIENQACCIDFRFVPGSFPRVLRACHDGRLERSERYFKKYNALMSFMVSVLYQSGLAERTA